MSDYLIYKFTSPSGKSYIGQTKNLKRRIREHKYCNRCRVFAKAIEKYGFESFILEILEKELTIEQANFLEEFHIQEHNTLSPNGYNLKYGGNNFKVSEESKERNRNSHLGKCVSEETKLKIKQATSGKNNPNFGNRWTDEQKRIHSLKFIGHKDSLDTRIKKSLATSGENNPNFGKPMSEQQKKKISEKLSGTNSPNWGKKYSEEQKRKMCEDRKGTNTGKDSPKAKKYIIIFPDKHKEIIFGLREFCRIYNLNHSSMSKVARGKFKSHKDYKCEYYIPNNL